MDWSKATWTPAHRPAPPQFPHVPRHIAEAAREAHTCFRAGAYRAVGSLARAVIEATAKEQGIEKGNVAAKIDALPNVLQLTKDQAHEIRHFGNDMAHGDFADTVEQTDAEDILGLMADVLRAVYTSPGEVAKRQRKRDGIRRARAIHKMPAEEQAATREALNPWTDWHVLQELKRLDELPPF